MFFKYAIQPESENPIFNINEHIGFDPDIEKDDGSIEYGDGQGIDGKALAREFFELADKKKITYYVNSLGGSVEDGEDIFNAIINSPAKTHSKINGFAYSTSGWLALAADKVSMYTHADFMTHLPYNPESSEPSEMIERVANGIAKRISDKSGRNGKPKLSVQQVKDMMNVKTHLNSQQMYDLGLIDEQLDSNNEKIKISESTLKNYYKKTKNIFNKFIPELQKSKNMPYPQVLNKLGLDPDSGERAILEAIAYKDNKISILNKEKEDDEIKRKEMKKKLEEMENERDEAKKARDKHEEDCMNKEKEYKKLKDEYDAMDKLKNEMQDKIKKSEEEKEEIHNKARKESATNLIEKFKPFNKAVRENPESWINRAIKDFEDTKMILESSSTNMSLPVPKQDKAHVDVLNKLNVGANKMAAEYRQGKLEGVPFSFEIVAERVISE